MATSSSASARRAARASAATRSDGGGDGSGNGDNVSAALLWTLRANPAVAESAASAPLPLPRITKSAPALLSTRRGPGRPKKADANAKSAAKWDDTVTSLLLQFRFVDMRAAFEGVRNNVEVGECWIQLAAEISRLSGKSFDSHQCQSKLRNLKKNWREISKGTKAATVSPLYAMLGEYLDGEHEGTAALTAAERSNSSAAENAGEQDESRANSVGGSRILRRNDSVSSAGGDSEAIANAGDEQEGDDTHGGALPRGGDGEEEEQEQEQEQEQQQDDDNATLAHETSYARGAEDALVGAGSSGGDNDADVVVAADLTGGSRSRSNSCSSSDSSQHSRASKRHKHDAVQPLSTHSLLVDTGALVAPAIRDIAQSSADRIDSSLLSVASGLRSMIEGVVASKEATSEQTRILSELREHNALMKRYCEEVSKQTASLNSLIELLAAKFSANGK